MMPVVVFRSEAPVTTLSFVTVKFDWFSITPVTVKLPPDTFKLVSATPPVARFTNEVRPVKSLVMFIVPTLSLITAPVSVPSRFAVPSLFRLPVIAPSASSVEAALLFNWPAEIATVVPAANTAVPLFAILPVVTVVVPALTFRLPPMLFVMPVPTVWLAVTFVVPLESFVSEPVIVPSVFNTPSFTTLPVIVFVLVNAPVTSFRIVVPAILPALVTTSLFTNVPVAVTAPAAPTLTVPPIALSTSPVTANVPSAVVVPPPWLLKLPVTLAVAPAVTATVPVLSSELPAVIVAVPVWIFRAPRLSISPVVDARPDVPFMLIVAPAALSTSFTEAVTLPLSLILIVAVSWLAMRSASNEKPSTLVMPVLRFRKRSTFVTFDPLIFSVPLLFQLKSAPSTSAGTVLRVSGAATLTLPAWTPDTVCAETCPTPPAKMATNATAAVEERNAARPVGNDGDTLVRVVAWTAELWKSAIRSLSSCSPVAGAY